MSSPSPPSPVPAADDRRRLSLQAKLLLLFGSVSVTLVALEIAFRFVMPASTHHEMYRESSDPVMRVELVPGADFQFEGVTIPIPPSQVAISQQGLRDVEHAIPKPPGEKRLLCVGDSTTFGWGVEMSDGFCNRLNTLLGPPWKTVNLGVPGYNSTQEVRRLEVVGMPFEPDVVMVLFDGNDYQPPIEYGGADSLLTWLSDRSALVRWVRQRLRGGGGAPEDQAHHDAGQSHGPGHDHHESEHDGGGHPDGEHHPDGDGHRPKEDGPGPVWDGEAKVLEAFESLAALREKHGFRVLVLMPNDDEDRALRELLNRKRIPFASIRPALWGKPEDVFIPVDNHPNAEGHRRLALLAARVLRERGVVAPAR